MYYIAAGNVMLDSVRFVDGSGSKKEHIGGPATFAYSGIKLWTDRVFQCSNVGADYGNLFHPWITENNIDTRGIKIVCDYSNHSYLCYNPDGTYGADESAKRYRSDWIQDFGYMKTTPEEIEEFTRHGNVKGLYIAQNVDHVFWEKMKEIKNRDKFKIMWEIEAPSSYKAYMESVKNAMKVADIFSINLQEAQLLFDVSSEQECIDNLKKMPIEISIFRVGKKGLYVVTQTETHFVPSAPVPEGLEIDPTGSGNTSTGSALYAYCEGNNPLMIGIMANVASSYNVRQYGTMSSFNDKRSSASELAVKLYNEYSN